MANAAGAQKAIAPVPRRREAASLPENRARLRDVAPRGRVRAAPAHAPQHLARAAAVLAQGPAAQPGGVAAPARGLAVPQEAIEVLAHALAVAAAAALPVRAVVVAEAVGDLELC